MKRCPIISLAVCIAALSAPSAEHEKNVLCTTFPVYQITRNVTDGNKGVTVELLLPASLGCPHHYSLTPRDLQKLTKADVLMINGSGLDDFLSTHLKKNYPNLPIINTSDGIEEVIKVVEHDKGHVHASVNPHFFTSPLMRIRMAENIMKGLIQIDPIQKEKYQSNAKAYAERMTKLSEDLSALGAKLANNRIVQPHGVFDYMARDMGLEIVAVLEEDGQKPSAAEMLKLIKTIKNSNAGAIFSEPQYSSKLAETIAKEAQLPTAELDPAASGPDNAPTDYFEKVMRKNMETISATLGTKE